MYYENLYQEKGPGLINQKEFLAKQNIKKLSDMQKNSCEGPIEIEEIKNVIKKIQK